MADTAGSQAFFNSPKYSDLTVVCGSDVYNLHRAIICPRSTWFDKACDGSFKEAKNTTIALKEDDPKAVNRMLIYLYTLDYSDAAIPPNQKLTKADETSKPPHLRVSVQPEASPTLDPAQIDNGEDEPMNNVLVYALADKYDLPGLKSIAKSKFIESTRETRWPYSNFAAVIKAVYTTTPAHDHGLRDPIVHICASHVLELALDNKLAATIKEIGDLSFAIMISLSKKRGEDQESIEEDRSRRKQILEGARMIEAAVRADLIKTKAELFTG